MIDLIIKLNSENRTQLNRCKNKYLPLTVFNSVFISQFLAILNVHFFTYEKKIT